MQRLNIDATAWHEAMRLSSSLSGRASGEVDYLRLHAKARNRGFAGLREAEQLYLDG